MRKKIYSYCLILIGLSCWSVGWSQSYDISSSIKIPTSTLVQKKISFDSLCYDKAPIGSIIKSVQTIKEKDKEITITKLDTISKENQDKFRYKKSAFVDVKGIGGLANLVVNEKDKNYLDVNYWLNKKETITKGKKIQRIKRVMQCDKKFKDVLLDKIPRTLEGDTTVYLVKYKTEPSGKDWYLKCDFILKVFSKDGQLEAVYVNKFDRTGTYRIKLKNREFLSYRGQSWEIAAISIPFKQRYGYTTDEDVEVLSNFSAETNLGLSFSYKYSRYRVRREGNSLKTLPGVGGKFGGFLGVSAVKLDSLNTTAGDSPFGEKESLNIPVISIGSGLTLSLYDLDIGVFLGWDFGVGDKADNWNYQGKPWLGLGLGYKLGGFIKKE